MVDKGETLLQPTQASLVVGASAAAIRNAADRGVLPCLRTVSGSRLFRLKDVKEFRDKYWRHRRDR